MREGRAAAARARHPAGSKVVPPLRAWAAHPVACRCFECRYAMAHFDDADDEGAVVGANI